MDRVTAVSSMCQTSLHALHTEGTAAQNGAAQWRRLHKSKYIQKHFAMSQEQTTQLKCWFQSGFDRSHVYKVTERLSQPQSRGQQASKRLRNFQLEAATHFFFLDSLCVMKRLCLLLHVVKK